MRERSATGTAVLFQLSSLVNHQTKFQPAWTPPLRQKLLLCSGVQGRGCWGNLTRTSLTGKNTLVQAVGLDTKARLRRASCQAEKHNRRKPCWRKRGGKHMHRGSRVQHDGENEQNSRLIHSTQPIVK